MKLIDILVEELPKRGGWPDDSDEMSQSQFDCEIYTESKFLPDFYVGERAEDNGIDNGVTREQYEAALAAKNEGWIEWGGGECPVEEGMLVDVRYRDSEHYPDLLGVYALSSFGVGADYWVRDGLCNDIIAYRLHKPTKSEQVHAAAWDAYAGITESDAESDLNECIGQDAAPVWNGEELPPVGCECQYRKHKKSEQSEWFNGVVKYTSEFTVVIQPVCYPGETVGHPANFEFRHIRSEADRKRDEAVKTIMLTGWCQSAAEEIYDLVASGKVPGMKLDY